MTIFVIPHLVITKEKRTLRKTGENWEQRMWGLRSERTNRSCQKVKFLSKGREKGDSYASLFFCFEWLDSLMSFLAQIHICLVFFVFWFKLPCPVSWIQAKNPICKLFKKYE